jgi:hypothetical protein
MKKRVISFSIFGDQSKYLQGIQENISLAHLFYPGWHVYIYYDNSVPQNFLNEFRFQKDVVLIDMTNEKLPGMFWRFLPYDDSEIELFIVRDLDSRISIREAVAVYEWVNSSKNLHIMRDHPFHSKLIMGGMWGLKRSLNFSIKDKMRSYLSIENSEFDLFEREVDQQFLEKVIYSMFFFSKIVHASFNKYEYTTKEFIVKRVDNSFIGETFINNKFNFLDREAIKVSDLSLTEMIKLYFLKFYQFCFSLSRAIKLFLKSSKIGFSPNN